MNHDDRRQQRDFLHELLEKRLIDTANHAFVEMDSVSNKASRCIKAYNMLRKLSLAAERIAQARQASHDRLLSAKLVADQRLEAAKIYAQSRAARPYAPVREPTRAPHQTRADEQSRARKDAVPVPDEQTPGHNQTRDDHQARSRLEHSPGLTQPAPAPLTLDQRRPTDAAPWGLKPDGVPYTHEEFLTAIEPAVHELWGIHMNFIPRLRADQAFEAAGRASALARRLRWEADHGQDDVARRRADARDAFEQLTRAADQLKQAEADLARDLADPAHDDPNRRRADAVHAQEDMREARADLLRAADELERTLADLEMADRNKPAPDSQPASAPEPTSAPDPDPAAEPASASKPTPAPEPTPAPVPSPAVEPCRGNDPGRVDNPSRVQMQSRACQEAVPTPGYKAGALREDSP